MYCHSTRSYLLQAKFLKSLLKDLFAFCLTFWWCTVLYIVKHTFTKRYLKDDSFCEPFVLASFFFSDFGLRTSYLQSLTQMTTFNQFNAFKYLKCIFFLETACFGKFFSTQILKISFWKLINWAESFQNIFLIFKLLHCAPFIRLVNFVACAVVWPNF